MRLLGHFGVEIDGRRVAESAWRHTRAAQLVKILALAAGRRMHREELIESLWPDFDADSGAANLRKAILFARAALGSAESVRRLGPMVALLPDADVVVDAIEFEQAAAKAIRSGTGIARVAATYTGELLPDDRFEPWAEAARDRLRARHLELLRAGGLWDEVVERDPTAEDAHCALMRRALDVGDRAAVVRRFGALREILRADLGVGPGAEAIGLYEQALRLDRPDPPTPAQYTASLLARALVRLNAGDLDEADALAERARRVALDAGLGRELGEASAVVGMVAQQRGSWRERFLREFTFVLGRDRRVASHVLDGQLCLAEYCVGGPGPLDELAGFARGLLDAADRAASGPGMALAHLLVGETALLGGAPDEARPHLTCAMDLYRSLGAAAGQVMALQRLAELALSTGGSAAARRLARHGLDLAATHWLRPHLDVRMHEILVRATPGPPASLRVVRVADEALAGMVTCAPCSIGFTLASAAVYAGAGRIEPARRSVDHAERLAGMWPGGPWHARLWETRGALRRAEGDEAQARAMLVEAARRYDESGRPADAARCRA